MFFWSAAHGGAVLALVLSVLLGRHFGLDTDLLSLLPPSSAPYAKADRILQERSARNCVILAESAGFDRARAAAEAVYRELTGYPQNPDKTAVGLFEELNFSVDQTVLEDFSAYLHEYRYMLLDPQSAALLEQGGAEQLAEDALARSYGALILSGLDKLDSDPFLLVERELRYFLDSSLLNGGLSLKDGVLAAEYEGKHYVLIRGLLSKEGASVNGGKGVREIYRAAEETAERFGAEPDKAAVRFSFSGVPFHSYESSSGAQKEITLLGGVTMLLLFVLFVRVFRSPLPVLLVIFAVLVSLVFGLSAAFLAFGTLHILTLTFGISLTGLCVDYSIHFLFQRRRGLDGLEARRAVFRGILLSFISSVICFLVFLFAPFGILRQFALFSAAGLASSCMTVFWLFPSLPQGSRTVPKNAGPEKKIPASGFVFFRKITPAVLALAAAGILFFGRHNLAVQNDLRSIYTMPPKLLEWERAAASVLNYNSGGFYFLVSGKDLEETLEHEEAFLARLDRGTFLGASLLTPPVQTQERRYRAASALLPLAEAQYRALGFPPGYEQTLREDYKAQEGHYALPSNVPPYAARILKNLLVGEAEGRWYSVVMPLGNGTMDVKDLAGLDEWIFPVFKTAGISAELDRLTVTMLKLLALSACLIIAAMAAYYRNAGKILRVAFVPVFSALFVLAVHVLLGQAFTFFSAAGCILVLGLGLDYMFYLTEDTSRLAASSAGASVTQAVVLSFATTALSFGALFFSSFTPVRLLVLAVVPGLSAAFICAMLLRE